MPIPDMDQHPDEFGALLKLLADEHPPITSILEVGVFQGGTLVRFRRHFPNAVVVGIDPRHMIQHDPTAARIIYPPVVNGCSQDRSVRQRAESLNSGEPFDFVFIDGDHTYDNAREDWEWSKREVRRIVAIHDIASRGNESIDCFRLWNEIVAEIDGGHLGNARHTEFRYSEKQQWGIGVVWLPT